MLSIKELQAKREALQETLETSLAEHPDDAVSHERIQRLLAWNRRELEVAKRAAKK